MTHDANEGSWGQATRYPDAAIEVLDPRFDKYRLKLSRVERLATGLRWAEGPVWFGDLRSLLVSDIPNNRILRWDEETGTTTVFRKPSNFANGHTRDRQGRLVSCEHGSRSVTRTEPDGTVTVLADGYRGKRLNSPNDVVVKSDGSVWFTDPVFGILGNYEGHPAPPELPTNVYRVDPSTREIVAAIEGIGNPNGLAFSPDERTLYLVECATTPRRILAYDVDHGGHSAGNRRVVIDAGPGTPDGFRCDVDGNLWCGWGMGSDELDGVRIFTPGGEAIGHIHLPERCANVCFGGVKRNRLFMAASQGIYALYVNTQGVAYF
ncbi:MAG TPA: SMP-30/gluconolactonase/LRE family protein [Usitatibacter sp.]|nr:SMP-30/gluconolactonase/LRE family protein [Usitatibacter sp.]